MESKAKLVGHPIHQMLIVFPLGLLATSVIFDIIGMATHYRSWHVAAFYCIGIGVIGGLLAALFGLIDWTAIPNGTRAKVVGMWHGGGNVVVVILFIISWWLRKADPAAGGIAPFVLSVIGVLLALVTGWLGGELVDRLGIGVDEGANPDAPSSLSAPHMGATPRTEGPLHGGTTGPAMG